MFGALPKTFPKILLWGVCVCVYAVCMQCAVLHCYCRSVQDSGLQPACSTELHLILEGSTQSLSPYSYKLLVQPLWELLGRMLWPPAGETGITTLIV